MHPSHPDAVDQQPGDAAVKHPIAKRALPRVFIFLLLAATILSVISMLSFLAYILIPTITHSASQAQYSLLYAIGMAGLAVAEACQIGGIVVLIVQWFSKQNTEKKPREIAVLVISLIPYMVILVFLVTLVVYLYLRRQASSPERQLEARQELKEQAVDTIIDYGANLSNSSATLAQVVMLAHKAAAPAMKDVIRQVDGPSAAKSVSGVSNGLLVSTDVVLIASTVALGSVALPLALQSVSKTPTPGLRHHHRRVRGKLLCNPPQGASVQLGTVTSTGVQLEPSSAILGLGTLVSDKNGTVWFADGDKLGIFMPKTTP